MTLKHDQIGQVALQNLNIALVRGGDQAVVKENDDHKELLYFGGGSVSTVKRSRTRTRAMMTAISDKLKTVEKVFVVGHKNLDMDALGQLSVWLILPVKLFEKAMLFTMIRL